VIRVGPRMLTVAVGSGTWGNRKQQYRQVEGALVDVVGYRFKDTAQSAGNQL